MATPERVADILVDVASQLVNGYDTFDFLYSVAEHALTLTGAKAAAVLLAGSEGQLQYMAATAKSAEILQDLAARHGDGPCQECYRTGERVIVADLEQALPRWPIFVPRAIALGYEAVHVLPLRFQQQKVGTLKLFLPRGIELDDMKEKTVQALADIVTITVLQDRNLQQAQTVNEQLQGALSSRIVIEQAKGALAHHQGIGVDEAFRTLRAYARDNQRRLTDLCDEVVNKPGIFNSVIEHIKSRG